MQESESQILLVGPRYIARGRFIQALLKAVRRWAGAAANLEIVLSFVDSGAGDVFNKAISVSAVLSPALSGLSPSALGCAVEVSWPEISSATDGPDGSLVSGGLSCPDARIDIMRGCPWESKTLTPKESSTCWCDFM